MFYTNTYNYHSICQRKVKLEKTFKEHHTTKGSQQCQKNKKHLRSSLTIFNCLLQHKGCGLLILYLSPTRSQEGCHHLSLSTENKQPRSMICWASFGCYFDVCHPPPPQKKKHTHTCLWRFHPKTAPLVVGLKPLRRGFTVILLGPWCSLKLGQQVLRSFQDILSR